jgi:dienelactone hydrolase
MKSTILLLLSLTLAPLSLGEPPAAAAPIKLLDPKPLTPGHQVVTLFTPGHPALKALAGSDQEENFKMGKGPDGLPRVAAVTNIHNPSIELYLAPAEKANGTSVILLPGGGNNTCNVGSEGIDIAAWFNERGVSCFVHRYRLKPYGSATDALADTQRAVRVVRAHAKEWNIDPGKIGHIGFSAGGEQTARLILSRDMSAEAGIAADPIDNVSCRADWAVLVYPGWVPGTLDMSHVPADPPPTFLVCAGTGDVFHARQTVEFYNALFDVGRTMKPKALNIEMHIYGAGSHGGAISARKGIPFGTWQQRLVDWMVDLKLMAGVNPPQLQASAGKDGEGRAK